MWVVFAAVAAALVLTLRWFGWVHAEATRRFIAAGAGRPGTRWFRRPRG